MKQGPNVKKLVVRKMSLLMVPPDGGMADAIKNMVTPGSLGNFARQASDWVESAIGLVKASPDNPYGDDDEAIAAEILKGIEARKGGAV